MVVVEIGRAQAVYGTVVAHAGQTDRLELFPAEERYGTVLANVVRNLRRLGEGDEELLLKLPHMLDGGYVWARLVRVRMGTQASARTQA